MTSPQPMPLSDVIASMTDKYYAESLATFAKDASDHVMTVAHDDGLYRRLLFRNPESGFYWFEIITSPGLLTLNGDIGTFVFSRIEDMLEFFTGGGINPMYWGEKLRASSAYRAYDSDRLKKLAYEAVDEYTSDDDWPQEVADLLRDAVADDVLAFAENNHEAHTALMDFRWSHTDEDGRTYQFEFFDSWEMDLMDYEPQFLWACHAIRAAVIAYRRYQQGTVTELAAA